MYLQHLPTFDWPQLLGMEGRLEQFLTQKSPAMRRLRKKHCVLC